MSAIEYGTTYICASFFNTPMDKNTLLGFGLLMLLLIGYIFYNQQGEIKYQQQKRKDSIENAKAHPKPVVADTSTQNLSNASTQVPAVDSIAKETFTLSNNEVEISFSNKGAYPTKVWLKKFKTYQGNPLILFDGDFNHFDFSFNTTLGSKIHSRDLFFNAQIAKNKITFSNPHLQIEYTLPDTGFMAGMNVLPSQNISNNNIDFEWQNRSLLTERDMESQKMYTQVCYNLEKDGYDYFTIKEDKKQDFNEAIKWLCFKQHYFNACLITDTKIIEKGTVHALPTKADTAAHALSDFTANMSLAHSNNIPFKLFYGPNDYKLLKSYKIEFEEIIPLSYGIFGFVKYINKWIILPIFNGLSKVFSSYGIVILILTFILRLLMSPFTYKSYVSSAKMKALKPELDALKEKYGEDKQTFGVEQMKLYRQAGVNPLGGCLPALLQLPVFFALLSFFPHAIELRQHKFLWAKDLSTYDSIINLPFTIPFYGDHVSLFTILFVITSLLMAVYSMNMTNMDQSNPMMKYMPFIMPVMFLGIFNKLPASLTFYYFVSNVITLGLQFVIQNWIIDPDKIHAQIQAKKNEAPKENKLMKRMAEIQKQNEARMRNSNKK
ncbi:MAG: membrane protein insertase YidC [Chitinophagaceae bacterium]